MSVSMNTNLHVNAPGHAALTSGSPAGAAHLSSAGGGSVGRASLGYGYGISGGRPDLAGDTKSVVAMADGSSVTVLRGPARDVLSVTTVPAGSGGVDVMA